MKKRKALTYFLAAIYATFMMGPFTWLIMSSVQPLVNLASVPPQVLLKDVTLKNYMIFSPNTAVGALFLHGFTNSAIVAVSSTLACVGIALLSAYSFARFSFRLKAGLYTSLLGSRMIPPIVFLIPLYVLFIRTSLIDTLPSLILVYTAFNLPYAVWILTGFFRGLPSQFEEAAMVDGCGRLDTLLRIVLPLSINGLIVTSLFVFIETWNEFIVALILTQRQAQTVQVVIAMSQGQITYDWGIMCAAAVIGCMPVVIFSMIFQRYIMKGLIGGALKF